MSNKYDLQNNLLNYVRKNEIPLIVYLTNGFQLRGKVLGFDNFTIIIEENDKEKLIYKHAISTIETVKNIENFDQLLKGNSEQ
ncbi:MAG TPA: RNA chaperone Hfq [Halanaerobiales bacterium]|nr:RNA chaperone Hfq [Halanaerobiales bacterium]